ncbi:hypothetical protein ACJW30_07G094700 [Castanea mollissima]
MFNDYEKNRHRKLILSLNKLQTISVMILKKSFSKTYKHVSILGSYYTGIDEKTEAITSEKCYNSQLNDFETLDILVTKGIFSYGELDARKYHVLYSGKDSFK